MTRDSLFHTHFDYADVAPLCTDAYLRPVVERALSSLEYTCRVADLGCGNGAMLLSLLRPGMEVCGVDGSPTGIAAAARAIPEGSFHVGDVTAALAPALHPGSFDAVISTETIEHLYTPRGLVTNAYTLLRPGGLFCVSTPYHGFLKNLFLSLSNRMDAHFTALWDGGHIKFWSRHTLTTLLLEAGFEDIRFEGVGRLPWLWKSMVLIARKPSLSPVSQN